MALKSTIHKLELTVSDLDRHHYATYPLTVARHPSETSERMMVRVLAFALFADERLEFGKGLSTDDEPALWQKSRSGEIERWIEVGLPDERVLRRASGRAREVVLLAYGGRAVSIWWEANRDACARLKNLRVLEVAPEISAALGDMADRTMAVSATLQDGHLMMATDAATVQADFVTLQG
ncbi:MAG: YaeQ family protein [Betaproteobacteria bacterium]|nr:YaeQ family protein [Betaproteobacteria bacterium]